MGGDGHWSGRQGFLARQLRSVGSGDVICFGSRKIILAAWKVVREAEAAHSRY